MNRFRIISLIAFVCIFVIIYQVGSMQNVTEEDATAFMEEFETIVVDIDGFGIFMHNTLIAMVMFIPGFGIAWGLFSAWATGVAFASIVVLTPELADFPSLFILLLSPFGLMELFAYSIALSRNFILTIAIFKKTGLAIHLRPTLIEIGIVLGLLLAGGYIEIYMIDMIQQQQLDVGGSNGDIWMPGL